MKIKEKFNELSTERKALTVAFVFVFMVFVSMGLVMERSTGVFGNGSDLQSYRSSLPTEYTSLSETPSDNESLKAIVKGSIYEEGDNMTVYGACFDNRGNLFPEAETKFTGWYPNGTIMVGPNASMDAITQDYLTPNGTNNTGRWKIHVTMGDTVGTYLTEMRCEYNNQVAVAFGEWQNPAWVVRIATTEQRLINASNTLDSFASNTSNTLQDILNQANSGNVDVKELERKLADIDKNVWVLDEDNPFYVLNSNTNNFVAVDMLSDAAVGAASSDGVYASWDGETWTMQSSNNTYRGVSLLPANQPYAWAVGSNGTNATIAVNGGSSPSNTPSTTAEFYNDVKLFQDPLNPAGNYYTYLLDSDGNIFFSNNSATTYTNIGTLQAAEKGRISQIVENYGAAAEPAGYTVILGQGNEVLVDDSVNQQTFNVNGNVSDVALLYHNYGYIVTKSASTLYIYKWDGTNLTEEFTVEDANIEPVAVDIHTQDDVWVATDDPSSFLHFDGRNWKISRVGFNDFITVLINFNGNASDIGIRDMRMVDSRHGYAVGGDGLVLEYQSESQRNFETLKQQISDISTNFSLNINSTELALEATILSINSSINENVDAARSEIQDMNTSVQLKLDNVLSNVTYTNQYLETTIFPVLNNTYTNTIEILSRLGIIEGQLNTTIDITNQTRSIVNESAQDIDTLLNRSDQDESRIKAWITP